MAITVTNIPKPTNLVVSLQAGGSHVDGTTRYYKMFGIGSSSASNATAVNMISPWSDEGSATFDATNKTAVLFWDRDDTNAVGYTFGRVDVTDTWATADNGASFFQASNVPYWEGAASLFNSTVDQDSAAGTTTLYTASTLPNPAFEYVMIGKGTAREEVVNVTAVSSGVSLTVSPALTYTHTAVQGRYGV